MINGINLFLAIVKLRLLRSLKTLSKVKKGEVNMAATKKTVATTAATKVEEPKTESKKAVTPVTTTVKTASAKATVKPAAAEKKEEVKTETAKKEPAKKESAKKETTKKETAVKKAPAKKAELKSEVHIQFSGKSYSQDDLMQIAKDVWKYDLKQKAGDLTSVELYVKPEENMVYYVMNKEMTGSFYI